MKPLRSRMAVAVISGLAVAGGFYGGSALLDHVQFAHAEQQVEATREQLSHVEDLSTVFRHVGKAVEPSVVNIQVHKTVKAPAGVGGSPDDLLRRFFHDQQGQGGEGAPAPAPETPTPPGQGDNGNGDGETFEQVGTGSGVIMEASDGYGYILTNNHVAGGATEMTITLNDGRQIKNGKVLGTDPKSDLAVVRIQADRLIPAKWGNSDELSQGDWILAFGSPFGYVGSMTHGIVSALHRDDVGIIQNGYENFIQVDAPINPGNSGGPLVNIRGEVVGINTAIASRSGGFQGIGFAIPSNQAKTVYAALKEHGKVVRGWLGVGIHDVANDLDLAHSFGYTPNTGVLVEETFPNTPASGKLQNGDIITAIDGKPVENSLQLRNAVAAVAPGTDVTLTVFRDGKKQDVTIKIGEQPDNLASLGNNPDQGGGTATPGTAQTSGMHLSDINGPLAEQFQLQTKTGAVVTQVDRGSVAAKAGLRPGDVITKVGRQYVKTAAEASAALSKADLNKGVALYITSAQGGRFVFLKSGENQ